MGIELLIANETFLDAYPLHEVKFLQIIFN